MSLYDCCSQLTTEQYQGRENCTCQFLYFYLTTKKNPSRSVPDSICLASRRLLFHFWPPIALMRDCELPHSIASRNAFLSNLSKFFTLDFSKPRKKIGKHLNSELEITWCPRSFTCPLHPQARGNKSSWERGTTRNKRNVCWHHGNGLEHHPNKLRWR